MSASDIKAGGAYIEIGARFDKLDSALSAAAGKMKAFADGFTSIGTKFAAIGGMMTAPIIAAAKVAADYGEQMGKLASKTGLSMEALAGLRYQTSSLGIGFESIGSAMKAMQRNVVDGSKDAQEAFVKLGVSQQALQGMSPDQQLQKVADALSNVGNEAQRSTLAQQIFGKAGADLLPVLEGGAAEMARMQRESKMLHTTLSAEAVAKLNTLDDAWDRLKESMVGVSLEIGVAVAPAFTKVINRATDCAAAFADWVKNNPKMVQAWTNIGAGIAAVGVAFIGVGAAVAALSSPVFLVTGGLLAIGAAALAITDTLGITATGFGDMFDAIRVDGTGTATWLTNAWRGIEIAWNTITANLSISWDAVCTGVKAAFKTVTGVVLVEMGVMIEAFGRMATIMQDTVNAAIKTWNDISDATGGKLGGKIDYRMTLADDAIGIGKKMRNVGGGMVKEAFGSDWTELGKRTDKTLFDRDTKNAALEAAMAKSFAKDFDVGKNMPKNGIDMDKFFKGFETLGAGVGDLIKSLWDKLGLKIPGLDFEPKGGPKPTGPDNIAWKQPQFSAIGTFSGVAGQQIGASGIFNQQLQELRDLNRTMKSVERNTAEGGGLV
jgi:TP901 family phage tail tape measure protein